MQISWLNRWQHWPEMYFIFSNFVTFLLSQTLDNACGIWTFRAHFPYNRRWSPRQHTQIHETLLHPFLYSWQNHQFTISNSTVWKTSKWIRYVSVEIRTAWMTEIDQISVFRCSEYKTGNFLSSLRYSQCSAIARSFIHSQWRTQFKMILTDTLQQLCK